MFYIIEETWLNDFERHGAIFIEYKWWKKVTNSFLHKFYIKFSLNDFEGNLTWKRFFSLEQHAYKKVPNVLVLKVSGILEYYHHCFLLL